MSVRHIREVVLNPIEWLDDHAFERRTYAAHRLYIPAFDYKPYLNGMDPGFTGLREELYFLERRVAYLVYSYVIRESAEVTDDQYDALCRRLAWFHRRIHGHVPRWSVLKRWYNRCPRR